MTSRNLTTNFLEFRNRATRDRNYHSEDKSNDDRTALIQNDDEEVVQFEKNNTPSWMDSQRRIQLQFDQVRSRMKKLQQLHDKHLTRPAFDENSSEEKEIESITKDITAMLNGCHTSVQQISAQANKSQTNAYDKRLSSNVVQATASALQDLTIKFRKCQSTYLHKLKSRKDNFNRIMPDLEIDMHSNPFGDQDDPDNNFDQISLTSEDQLQLTSQNVEFLEKRDKEIHEVLKSIEDINEIFRDVAALVSNQGTILDQIEYNIENTVVQLEQGNKHLTKAVQHKRRGLKFKLILIGVCLSVLFFIIFVARYLSQANLDVVKRYLPANIQIQLFQDKSHMLAAINNDTIIAGITTGQLAQDLQSRYHVFTSSIVSPQAMLVAPDYDAKLAPYGLRNQSSNDLFNALNAAINGVQNDGTDETLVTLNQREDLIRVYTCRQSTQIPVVNRNDTTGFLQDVLFNTKKLLIGGIGPSDWGKHDGNYKVLNPIGFYPELLDKIVEKLGQLSGPDGNKYGEGLTIERTYYQDSGLLFSALLNGKIHATDVYTLVDVSYTGSGENCTKDNNTCRAEETCTENICTHAPRPRSLHFRTTCTTASRDTKFITKKFPGIKSIQPDAPRQTPKTRWIGFVLLFVTLFATVFLVLVILLRRKKNYRAQHTLQGGFGKFVRLQEESEPPMDGLDAFDDHIVQSPRDNTN
ncbi:unnamed protein product [Adineta steineri]|uniref:t-SNARE coiled-coil homology domain-containing protein n=1 Tax=Adineta steineri TaxID=433720 RepID=A0A814GWR3_9BILA|nr:unnamed protein product [Adineta steineri]CAF3752460.1 unnamed protein product [Adineta steineri]